MQLLRSFPVVCAALAFLAIPLGAQRTIRVSGSGSSLRGAFASARHGDTILAAPGFYNVGTGLVTDQGITFVGSPGTVVYGTGAGTSRAPVLTVRDLPAGERFVMRGVELRLGGYSRTYAYLFEDNVGGVHLSRCAFGHSNNDYSVARELGFVNCAVASLTECTTNKVRLYVLGASNVHASSCTLEGHEGRAHSYSGRSATHAAWVHGPAARLALSRCSLTGGAGAGRSEGAAALVLLSGQVHIAGDARDTYAAGDSPSTASRRAPALHNLGGELLVAAAITLQPNPGEPVVQGGHESWPRPIAMAVQTAAGGGTLSSTVVSDDGDALLLFLGVPSAPWAAPPVGLGWLESDTLLPLASTTLVGREQWTWTATLPRLPQLSNVPVTMQALGVAAGGPLRLSLPATFVIE